MTDIPEDVIRSRIVGGGAVNNDFLQRLAQGTTLISGLSGANHSGLWGSMTDEQKALVRDYKGSESVGDPNGV